jgi:lipid-binding SYLF domain-containing protein
MTRWILAIVLAFVPLVARAQTEQQALVDRATLTVQDMITLSAPEAEVHALMRRAKGIMICPQVFKAGFILGAQGGGCVLVGRGPAGWSGPAFYGMGSGSVGLQIGIQDSQVILIILTDNGLRALLDDQFKIGAGASLAFATVGAGVEGATTGAFNADIVAFQNNRGLFAGLSLDGMLIGARSAWNQLYYGQPMAAQQVVLGMQGRNPGAAPLQEMLGRASGGFAVPYAAAQESPPPYQAPYVPPRSAQPQYAQPQYGQPQYGQGPVPLAPGSGAVQSTPLPPPGR